MKLRRTTVRTIMKVLRAQKPPPLREPPQPVAKRIDRQVLDGVFSKYRGSMKRVAAKIVGWDDAEDVVNDAQLGAYRAQTIDPEDPWPYLRTCTLNKALEYRRKVRRSREVSLITHSSQEDARSHDGNTQNT